MKRDTIPDVPGDIVNRTTLRHFMAQGSDEMDQCVSQGKFPVFGYPLVCYSPIGRPNRETGEFWGHLYRQTMASGTINMIGELLQKNEEFDMKEKDLYRNFARGRIMKPESSSLDKKV